MKKKTVIHFSSQLHKNVFKNIDLLRKQIF